MGVTGVAQKVDMTTIYEKSHPTKIRPLHIFLGSLQIFAGSLQIFKGSLQIFKGSLQISKSSLQIFAGSLRTIEFSRESDCQRAEQTWNLPPPNQSQVQKVQKVHHISVLIRARDAVNHSAELRIQVVTDCPMRCLKARLKVL